MDDEAVLRLWTIAIIGVLLIVTIVCLTIAKPWLPPAKVLLPKTSLYVDEQSYLAKCQTVPTTGADTNNTSKMVSSRAQCIEDWRTIAYHLTVLRECYLIWKNTPDVGLATYTKCIGSINHHG